MQKDNPQKIQRVVQLPIRAQQEIAAGQNSRNVQNATITTPSTDTTKKATGAGQSSRNGQNVTISTPSTDTDKKATAVGQSALMKGKETVEEVQEPAITLQDLRRSVRSKRKPTQADQTGPRAKPKNQEKLASLVQHVKLLARDKNPMTLEEAQPAATPEGPGKRPLQFDQQMGEGQVSQPEPWRVQTNQQT